MKWIKELWISGMEKMMSIKKVSVMGFVVFLIFLFGWYVGKNDIGPQTIFAWYRDWMEVKVIILDEDGNPTDEAVE